MIEQQQQLLSSGDGGGNGSDDGKVVIDVQDVMLDLHSKFVLFDGKAQPHETLPFTGGDRYTIVYYTSDMGSRNKQQK